MTYHITCMISHTRRKIYKRIRMVSNLIYGIGFSRLASRPMSIATVSQRLQLLGPSSNSLSPILFSVEIQATNAPLSLYHR